MNDRVLEFRVNHGVAAVLDDDGLPVVFLQIGKRFDEHARLGLRI